MSVLEDRVAGAREELRLAQEELDRLSSVVAGEPAWLSVGDPSRFSDQATRERAEDALRHRGELDQAALEALRAETRIDALLAAEPTDERIDALPADEPTDELGPGAVVGVLLPVRLETRFTAPEPDAEPGTDAAAWWLRIRVEPDRISLAAPAHQPTSEERTLVAACWTTSKGHLTGDDGGRAFGVLADQVGPARAAHLLRTVTVTPQADGRFAADDGGIAAAGPRRSPTRQLVGLPQRLEIWAQRIGNDTWELLGTLLPDHEQIAKQASLEAIAPSAGDSTAPLPRGWWNSFSAAQQVGLAARIKLGEPQGNEQPEFRVVLCVGMDTATGEDGSEHEGLPLLHPRELFAAHSDSGLMAPLAPLTQTNTVAGTPTVDPGRATDTWFNVSRQAPGSGGGITWALTGSPVLDGVPDADLSLAATAQTLVTALWPVVWQRGLKDFLGLGGATWTLGDWGGRHLAPFGPFPLLRLGDLPYGLLPLTAAPPWREFPPTANFPEGVRYPEQAPWPGEWGALSGLLAAVEHLIAFMLPQADSPGPPAADDPAALLELIAEVPTTREYGSRSLPLLTVLALLNEAAHTGLPSLGDNGLIARWRRRWQQLALIDPGRELAPLGPTLPWPTRVQDDYHDAIERYLASAWEQLAHTDDKSEAWHVDGLPPPVLARLVRHSLLLTQAEVTRLIDPDFPDWRTRYLFDDLDPQELAHDAGRSGARVSELPDEAVSFAQALSDGAVQAAVFRQFEDVREAIRRLLDNSDRDQVAQALPAVLDCASHRPDAWDTAVAHTRLLRLAATQASWVLGAYGWVDGLRPNPDPTPPTNAGLLHAPGYYQALTSAVLRDHAVHPTDQADADRWAMNLESAGIRLAARLAEDVRLGVHLSEALGREIERRVGEPGRVQELRRAFPARPEWQGRRVCDGQRVLDATGTQPQPDEANRVPSWLQPLADELFADLRRCLDTYADLLLADAVHDVVGGRPEAAAEALQASTGLQAPPQLRLLRTQREAGTVKTTVCVAVPWQGEFETRSQAAPGATTAAASPLTVLDPALLELLSAELGTATEWTWTAAGATVTLDELQLGLGDIVTLGTAAVRALAAAALDDAPGGGSAPAKCEVLERICTLLASGPRQPGDATDLQRRLDWLRAETEEVAQTLEGASAASLPAAISAARRFGIALTDDATVADAQLAAQALRQRLGAHPASAETNDPDPDLVAAAIRGILSPAAALPLICPAPQPTVSADPSIDHEWLELIAPVRPSMARLELHQLTAKTAWIATADVAPGTIWDPPERLPNGREGDRAITVVYHSSHQQRLPPGTTVGLTVLDSWAETVPARHHTTWTAFGFDAPRARAPQAVLLALPPDPTQPWTTRAVRDVVTHARDLARARAVRVPLADPFPAGIPTAIALDTGPAACSLYGEAP